jgi:hypothetical protein
MMLAVKVVASTPFCACRCQCQTGSWWDKDTVTTPGIGDVYVCTPCGSDATTTVSDATDFTQCGELAGRLLMS